MSRARREPGTILVVDDTPANIGVLLGLLGEEGHKVLVATDGESALEQLRYTRPDLLLLDVMMPGLDGFEVCRRVRAMPELAVTPILFLTALDEPEDILRGFAAGAADYVAKPLRHAEVMARVNVHLALCQARRTLEALNDTLEQRVRERTAALETSNAELASCMREITELKNQLQRENSYLRAEVDERLAPRSLIGAAPAWRAVLAQVGRVAPTASNVLITGETGAGKELIARAVHDGSPRAGRAMIKLNCAAIASGLVESELFGHARGAFTGATEKRSGRFALADGGTLFLDEVSELPLDTQVKLLRVLQEREFEPVGSAHTIRVDVRVVAASNRDLPAEVAAGRFRADLYHRLNVFPIAVPPLRARREDIAALAQHFLDRNLRSLGKHLRGITPDSLERLLVHDWPGNVRELQNVIERAAILAPGDWLEIEPAMLAGVGRQAQVEVDAAPAADRAAPLASMAEVQRRHIIAVLRETAGVIEGEAGAARLLNMKPSTARYRIRKLGIVRDDYL